MNGSILGNAVTRREDPRLIRGEGSYVGDMTPPGLLHAAFVRSDLPHGLVQSIDQAAALAVDGVIEIVTRSDLRPLETWGAPAECARVAFGGIVRYVGDVVAVVLAESERAAHDAASQVFVDIDPLPSVVDPELAAHPDAPVVFAELGSNIALAERAGYDRDPLDGADIVVEARFVNQRLAPMPMEGSACLVIPEAGSRLRVYLSTQDVFGAQSSLADVLGVDTDQIRVVAPDVGGGFGAKGDLMIEHAIVAEAAARLGRPVRWVERRSENLTNMMHGRAQVQYVRIGATRNGKLVGIELDVIADLGAYPGVATWLPRYTLEMVCGCYEIPRASASFQSVVTNTTPVGAYRGAGRPEAIQAVERAMDLLAHELGIDPVELRRTNLIPPFSTPVVTGFGTTYDSGNYASALEMALSASDHKKWIKERDTRRERRDRFQIGVGVACYVEVTVGKTPLHEFGSVELEPSGRVIARAGGASQGQGHETAFAQIVADRFQIPMGNVVVIQGDTGQVRTGGGTFASRTVQLAGSSLFEASNEVIERARQIAAEHLEASPDDIVIEPGIGLGVAGVPGSVLSWAEIAAANQDPIYLSVEGKHRQAASTYPFGAHVAIVEVDTETGWARLVEHTAVDDCGNVLNPMLVKGQQHGGIAQGAGQALMEHARFDDDGYPLTANLVTYPIFAASDLPAFRTLSHVTPTPHNPLGAKGVGEAGTLGSTPAIHSAALDALALFDVRHVDMPMRPERVWQATTGRLERTRP